MIGINNLPFYIISIIDFAFYDATGQLALKGQPIFQLSSPSFIQPKKHKLMCSKY